MNTSDIGNFVRTTRKQQGLRQNELAAAANVGVRFLIELESGKDTAQIGKVLSVLQALGIDLRLVPPGGASTNGSKE